MFIYGEYGAGGAAKAYQKLKTRPRIFMLKGRMVPEESHAVFELEQGSFPEGLLELSLIHLAICIKPSEDNEDGHRHFEPPRQTEFPNRAIPYKKTITTQVPRPIPLTVRRRTLYFESPELLPRPTQPPPPLLPPPIGPVQQNVDPDAPAAEDPPPGPVQLNVEPDNPAIEDIVGFTSVQSSSILRLKRAADDSYTEITRITKRAKRSLGSDESAISSPFKIYGYSTFTERSHVVYEPILRFSDLTIPALCDKIANVFKKCEVKFLSLFPNWPTILFVPDIENPDQRANTTGKIHLELPPKCKIAFGNKDLLFLLGFSDEVYTTSAFTSNSNTSFSIIENSDPEQFRKLVSTTSFRSREKLSAIIRSTTALKTLTSERKKNLQLLDSIPTLIIGYKPIKEVLAFQLVDPTSLIPDGKGSIKYSYRLWSSLIQFVEDNWKFKKRKLRLVAKDGQSIILQNDPSRDGNIFSMSFKLYPKAATIFGFSEELKEVQWIFGNKAASIHSGIIYEYPIDDADLDARVNAFHIALKNNAVIVPDKEFPLKSQSEVAAEPPVEDIEQQLILQHQQGRRKILRTPPRTPPLDQNPLEIDTSAINLPDDTDIDVDEDEERLEEQEREKEYRQEQDRQEKEREEERRKQEQLEEEREEQYRQEQERREKERNDQRWFNEVFERIEEEDRFYDADADDEWLQGVGDEDNILPEDNDDFVLDVDAGEAEAEVDVNVINDDDNQLQEIAEQEADQIENLQDAFEDREIPNPEIEPPRHFYYADPQPSITCGKPQIGIPKACFVLVKEGEPRDFFFERGPVAFFGTIAGKTSLTVQKSNPVYLKNFNSLNSLRLEFVDKSFNTIKLPEPTTAFFTMIISCDKLY